MFIRRSKYKALVKSRDKWKELTERSVKLNESLCANNEKLIKVCTEVNNQNKMLIEKLEKKFTEGEGCL